MEESRLLQYGVFGRQVELFLEGEIGTYLLRKAQREIDEAVEKLKKVNPNDIDLVRTYQNDIRLAESIAGWLGDAIAEGHAAIETLKGEEDAT